jgi:lipopolysaccharide core galacturonosyltransferase RgtB
MLWGVSSSPAEMSIEKTSRSPLEISGRTLLICIGIYFALHVLTRSLVSNNLQVDEAEQLIFTQNWAWGFGSQPPLYNWIQKVFFSVFGLNVFALSFLKNAILWAFYAFFYLAAREIFAEKRHAVLATVSIFFIPAIVWESQRDQTHLVLATACAAATLFVFMRICKGAGAGAYAALGMFAAFGVLAKYNYAFLLPALALAALTSRFRGVILTRRILITVAVFLLITWPHFDWLLHHRDLATSQTYKFKLAEKAGAASAYVTGTWQLAKAAAAFLLAPTLVFLPLLAHFRGIRTDEWSRFFLRLFAFGLILGLVMILCFRVTYFRDRWLQPLFFAYPMLLVGLVAPRLTAAIEGRFLALSGAVAITVLLVMNGVVLGANQLNRAHNLNIPFAALAEKLKRSGFQRGSIVADRFIVGGNLKMQFPESRIIIPGREGNATKPQGPTMIVWRLGNDEDDANFVEEAAQLCGVEPKQLRPQMVQVRCDNGPRKLEKFGFVLLN